RHLDVQRAPPRLVLGLVTALTRLRADVTGVRLGRRQRRLRAHHGRRKRESRNADRGRPLAPQPSPLDSALSPQPSPLRNRQSLMHLRAMPAFPLTPALLAAAMVFNAGAPSQTGASRLALAQVTDPRGKSIVDVGADDFVVQEGGAERDILDVR